MINLTDVPTATLVAAHNACAEMLGSKAVTRFADRATAEKRTRFVLSQIEPEKRPEPFRELTVEAPAMKGSVLAKDAPHPAIKSINSESPKPETSINLASGDIVQDGKKVGQIGNQKAAEAHVDKINADLPLEDAVTKKARAARQSRAAKDAIAAAPSPTAPVRPSLPIPSNNPTKDAEMPALRRVVRPTELAPKAKLYPRRAGSKQAILVDMLSRPEGATFAELYDALAAGGGKPWRGVTIRSGLAWDMNTLAGYGITTELLNGMQFAGQGRMYEALRLGVETMGAGYGPGPAYDPTLKLGIYRLTYPRGVTGPLPHTQKKGPTPAQKAAAKVALEAALADASKKA